MSYLGSGATETIARYQKQSSGKCVDMTTGQSVVSFYCEGQSALTTATPKMDEPWYKKLWGGFTTLAQQRAAGAGGQPVVVSGGTPSWIMPVAIGGIALGAVLLLTKKKAPTSNPARRRRRRRR